MPERQGTGSGLDRSKGSRHDCDHLPPGFTRRRARPRPPRLTLAPTGSAPALLDAAWWPRSRHLDAELPALAAVLDPLWGRITRISVNPGQWPLIPRKVLLTGHVVKVGWFRAEQDQHELLLFSYHMGRRNLLVVPPQTPSAQAAWLLAAASDPTRTSTGGALMAEAAHLGDAAETDRTVEAL
ncbi:DUF5994 family protein [Streptomyces flaveolus]|uniref:DUF5994 family protein n=1 Tax=Streptomyces flaveolus TaxID=67297 RepID=UPI0034466DD5